MVAFTAMPSARVRTATAVKPGLAELTETEAESEKRAEPMPIVVRGLALCLFGAANSIRAAACRFRGGMRRECFRR